MNRPCYRRGMRAPSIVAVLASVAALVACGGSSPPPQPTTSGACPTPQGGYVLTMDATDGDCGGMTRHREQLVVMGQAQDPECKSVDERVTPRPDGCVYESTQICQRAGIKMTANVSVAVPPDTRDLRGTLVYQIEGNGGRCLQRYAVRYAKNGP